MAEGDKVQVSYQRLPSAPISPVSGYFVSKAGHTMIINFWAYGGLIPLPKAYGPGEALSDVEFSQVNQNYIVSTVIMNADQAKELAELLARIAES